jgi:hypothetical protein
MGTGPSKSQQQYPQLPGQPQSGPPNRLNQSVNPGITLQPTQPSKIYDLQFILDSPPPIIPQPQQNTSRNKVQQKEKLDTIKAKILEYNKTWNFGNQSDGLLKKELKKETYDNFILFVTKLIQGGNTPNQTLATNNANAKSFRDKQNIIREIHKLILSGGGNQLLTYEIEVKMSDIFPNISDGKQNNTMMVNLLGLASIIGAEHIVIYLLMIGANPSITKTDNRDSATLMLSFQIGLYKLLQQQQPINQKYFIILPRILYILFLLGSIGVGVDLSAIFETNEEKNNKNNSTKPKIPVESSILNMLAQMPGNTDSPTETARQTLQNGGSIPLLLEILEKNNPNAFTPKFFKTVDSLERPYDINVLYSVLMNPNIDDKTKLELTKLLVLKYNAIITNVPTFIERRTNIDIFESIILAIDDIKFTNPQTKLSILEIFSVSNKEFKDKLEKSGLLSKYSNSSSNTNKNAKIKRLETVVALLREKSKLITNGLAGNIAALGAKSALINAEVASLTGNPPTGFGTNKGLYQLSSPQSTANKFATGQPQIPTNPFSLSQPQIPTNPFTTNQTFAQQGQPQIQPTGFGTNPALSQQFLSNSLSQSSVLQSQQMQPPGATLEKKSSGNRFNRFKFWKKGNNGQAAAQKNSQSTLRPLNTKLPQAASQINPSTNLPQKPKQWLFNSLKGRIFGKKNNKGLPVAQPAPLSSIPPISLQSPILNTTASSGLSQTVLPLNSPQNRPLSSASLQSSASLNKPLNTTASSGLSQTVSPLNSPPNLPLSSASLQSSASLNKPLNTTASSGLSQTVSPLNSPPNLPVSSTSLQPVDQPNLKQKKSLANRAKGFFGVGKKNQTDPQNTSQAGGKKIQMRTYHFLKHKKYSERAFIAERPIIAADNAYDFMKIHYDIGSKKITFTIHDRVNNKKYKYTARTLKDGTNVIKSAK